MAERERSERAGGAGVVVLVLCLLAAVAGLACAHAGALVGSPAFERFEPRLDVLPQNFAIAQDDDGIVYVGNVDGVLEFDGEHWTLVRLPNHEIARSLRAGADGRIWVGGYNIFGVLQRDDTGRHQFSDYSAAFANDLDGRDFADIWDIQLAPEGIWFRGVHDLFLSAPDGRRLGHWHRAERFGAIRHHHGRTLGQWRGEGLREFVAGQWQPLPDTAALTELVYDLVPLADGSLLTLGSRGDWWRIEGAQARPQPMPEAMPPSSHVSRGLALPDGSLVFAGKNGMLHLLDAGLQRPSSFRIDPGFLSGLHTARDGGFLVVGDLAIHRVAWPAAWTVLGLEHGLSGRLVRVREWQGRTWLATGHGLRPLRSDPAAPIGDALGGEVNVHDLLPLADGRALIAENHRLFLLADGAMRPLHDELSYPRLLQRSQYAPARIFVGTALGLRTLHADDLTTLSPLPFDDPPTTVTTLFERSRDEAWVGTERHGVWRYRFGADGRLLDAERMDQRLGIRSGPIAEMTVGDGGDGQVLIGSNRGFWIGDGERMQQTLLDGLDVLRGDEEVVRVFDDPAGGQWAYSYTRLYRREPGAEWTERDVRGMRRGALLSHHFAAAGQLLLVSTQALLAHTPGVAARSGAAPRVQLRAVTLHQPDGRRQPLPLAGAQPTRVPAGPHGVEFRFALPELARAEAARYQGRLLGYEEQYSDWSRARAYTYWRLAPGTYRLDVRARDALGNITELEPYTIVIVPPWYRHRLAQGAGGLLLLLLAVWIARGWLRLRTARMQRDYARLERLVEARTRELADANRRLDTIAHLDGLTGIANRRRLDDYLPAVWAQCREQRRPLSLLAIDVDRFKAYNDGHGHQAGDELLRRLADVLGRCLRRSEDLLARYGGEEFMVVMPGAAAAVAADVAETLRSAVEHAGLGATISVGVAAAVPTVAMSAGELIERADAALYAAKRAGRNRVVVDTAIMQGDR